MCPATVDLYSTTDCSGDATESKFRQCTSMYAKTYKVTCE